MTETIHFLWLLSTTAPFAYIPLAMIFLATWYVLIIAFESADSGVDRL